jgi:ribose transport system substrate-binding protein
MKKPPLLYLVSIGVYEPYARNSFMREQPVGRGRRIRRPGRQPGREARHGDVQSGIDCWKSVIKGFGDAAQVLGVSVEYRGSTKKSS